MLSTNLSTKFGYGSFGGIEPQRSMTEPDQKIQEAIAELTLLLISLTSWQEKILSENVTQSWKGYDFHILDELKEKGYISGSKGSKLIVITNEGLKKTEELTKKYLSR
jgi:hypothetical protein